MSQSVELEAELFEAGTAQLTFLSSSDFIRPRGIDDPLPTERDIAPTGELTLETTRILAGRCYTRRSIVEFILSANRAVSKGCHGEHRRHVLVLSRPCHVEGLEVSGIASFIEAGTKESSFRKVPIDS